MELCPSLVIILGSRWSVLQPRIKRWFEAEVEAPAFEVLALDGEDDSREPVRRAIARLFEPSLIKDLETAGYISREHVIRSFRTLVFLDHDDLTGLQWVHDTVADCLMQQPNGAAVNRMFWLVAFGPGSIQEIASNNKQLHEPFGSNESCSLFHIMPYWRATLLSAEDQAAIAERLAILLLKMDMSPKTDMIKLLDAPGRSWLIGLEGHLLHKLDDAVRRTLGLAVVRGVGSFFEARPRTPAILRGVVRDVINAFSEDARLDPNTETGRMILARYRSRWLPALLDRLAPYADSAMDFICLLRELEDLALVRKPRPESPPAIAPALALALPSIAAPMGITAFLTIAAAASAFFLWRRSVQPPAQPRLEASVDPDLPYNELFVAALGEAIGSLAELQSDEREIQIEPRTVQPVHRLSSMDNETPIWTDSVRLAQCSDEEMVRAQGQILGEGFRFSQLLAAHWLTTGQLPVHEIESIYRVLSQIGEELRSNLLVQWLAVARSAHPKDQSEWMTFLFSPKPPAGSINVYEMAEPGKQPGHAGWFPETWLHYLYLVECH